jgi:hypothetical protein
LYLGSGKTATGQVPVEDDIYGEDVHSLNILAIHLALVARPGAKWIALSLSRNRFPFLSSYKLDLGSGEYNNSVPSKVIDRGLPDPSRLWTTICKKLVPMSGHWIYVLERTSEELKVRGT